MSDRQLTVPEIADEGKRRARALVTLAAGRNDDLEATAALAAAAVELRRAELGVCDATVIALANIAHRVLLTWQANDPDAPTWRDFAAALAAENEGLTSP